MTATITPPEWLTVGAKVAVVTYGTGGGIANLRTVEKITATTVVVGGDRYRLDTLRRSTSTWGPSYSVEDPKDPATLAILRRTAAERAGRRAETALSQWRQDKFSPESAAVVRDALAALAPYLNPAEETQR